MKVAYLTFRQQRIRRIHELLAARRRDVTCKRIARELEVHPRTVLRDVDFMRVELHLPIDYDPTTHTLIYSQIVESVVFDAPPPRPQRSAATDAAGLVLDDEPAKHLAVICERHGVQMVDVLRAVIGNTLAEAVCNSSLMREIVRAARVLAVEGKEGR